MTKALDNEMKNKYIDNFYEALDNSNIDFTENEIIVEKQLYYIFIRLELFRVPRPGFKNYYLGLLSSKSKEIRGKVWGIVEHLFEANIINVEKLELQKANLFDILKSSWQETPESDPTLTIRYGGSLSRKNNQYPSCVPYTDRRTQKVYGNLKTHR